MNLEEKLRAAVERAGAQREHEEARKSLWIEKVSSLYKEVQEWLRPYVEKGYMTLSRSKTTVSEELVGDYEIEELRISAGDETFMFRPHAMNVIGASGRIDLFLRGYRSEALVLLLLEDAEGNERWEVRESKSTGFRKDFNKETLEEILYRWL